MDCKGKCEVPVSCQQHCTTPNACEIKCPMVGMMGQDACPAGMQANADGKCTNFNGTADQIRYQTSEVELNTQTSQRMITSQPEKPLDPMLL